MTWSASICKSRSELQHLVVCEILRFKKKLSSSELTDGAISSRDFVAQLYRATKLRVWHMACRTLQLCRINNNWPISVHRIFATKLHRTERCSSNRKKVAWLLRSCATRQCDAMSHLRFCRAIKLCNKIARQNCRCDIGLKFSDCPTVCTCRTSRPTVTVPGTHHSEARNSGAGPH